jgi:hypothetical protein
MPVPSVITALSETPSANSPAGSETVGTQMNDYIQAAMAFIAQVYHGKSVAQVPLNMNGQQIINLADGGSGQSAATVAQLNRTLGAPSGTRVVFQQASAPAGWIVDGSSTLQDAAVRFSAGAGGGGSVGWSAWNFGGTFAVSAHAITPGEMPSHNHLDGGHGHGVNDPGHGHGLWLSDPGHQHNITYQSVQAGNTIGGVALLGGGGSNKSTDVSATNISAGIYGSGTGIYLSTGYANIGYAGGNQAHNHTFTTPQVKFADVVVCVKA